MQSVGTALAARAEGGIWQGSTSATSALPTVNVAIQAGHWKNDELPDALARLRGSTGAAGGGRTESQVNLDVAQRVARLLKAKGLTVEVLPATVPTAYQADLFISLHADGSSSTGPRGYKVSTRNRSDVAALDALLVQTLESAYGRTSGMPEDPSVTRAMRGYYAYSTYHGEEYRLGSTTPAAIVEMGFMSNATDRALMFNNPELLARSVVAGIDAFYAQRSKGTRLQLEAERQAAASAFGRSVVVMSDGTNVRADATSSARKVATALLGQSFALLQNTGGGHSPGSQPDPPHGTQLAANSGWYQISTPGTGEPAYISRDFVVVQE